MKPSITALLIDLSRIRISNKSQMPSWAQKRVLPSSFDACAELMDPLNRRMVPIKESHLEASALSAALGSPNPNRQTVLPE